jgi:hypothetical protein
MTISLAGQSGYAMALRGLLVTVALSPLWGVGCASDDPAAQPPVGADTDAGTTPTDTCADGKRTGEETDIDCGGDCGKCVDGKFCATDDDCVNGACIDLTCRAPACDDGRKNGNETDVDCGGGCEPCNVKMTCAAANDCSSGVCGENKKCLPTTCGDKQKNGLESDVDCGGPCVPCGATKACRSSYDCNSAVCDASGKCAAPACDDEVLNGDETDLDCGGSCSTKCAENKKCNLDEHCATNICSAPPYGDTTRRCRAPGCNNYAMDSGETDVDCGGPCGTKCQDGKRCSTGADCNSKVCNSAAGTCATATCTDGIQNGSESDVDCGYQCPCEVGRRCSWGGECKSGVCNGETQTCAAPSCTDGTRNGDETDVDCGGSCATKCNAGQVCAVGNDCASGTCTNNACVAP